MSEVPSDLLSYRPTDRDILKERARNVLYAAIREGKLPRASTLKCADCGRKARDYDHRDYRKPLEVEPVCRRCNILRGPGLPEIGPNDGWRVKRFYRRRLPTVGRKWSRVETARTANERKRVRGMTDYAPAAATVSSEIFNLAEGLPPPRPNFYRDKAVEDTGGLRSEFFKRHDPWYDE